MTQVIKGEPRKQWEAVQSIQHEPFIYIMGNGSKWAGQEEEDLDVLLEALKKYKLDLDRTSITHNPCQGVTNPNWAWGNDEPQWIDGPRLYTCDGVVRFGGNFLELSHGFSIDTNDIETITTLTALINENLQQKGPNP